MYNDYKFWKGKKVLITGHTGFKGSWLSLLLKEFGAKVYGYSLKPEKNFLYDLADLDEIFEKSIIGNILDKQKLKASIKKIEPNVIFHLAAEPLVIDSYTNPEKTFNVNFIGTLNLLESIKIYNKKLKTLIIVTTDKVYKILKNNPNYNENHSIGASDPYGTSKACVELLAETYFNSFLKKKKINIFTARAGNVIGGGDFSKNRIIPDYLRSINKNRKLIIRNPNHIRPWQYVLEPLYGYTLLVKKNYLNNRTFSSWNFSPTKSNTVKVKTLISIFQAYNKKKNKIKIIFSKNNKNKLKETKILRLNSNKSKKKLKIKLKFDLNTTVKSILEWNQRVKIENYFDVSTDTIKKFLDKK